MLVDTWGADFCSVSPIHVDGYCIDMLDSLFPPSIDMYKYISLDNDMLMGTE